MLGIYLRGTGNTKYCMDLLVSGYFAFIEKSNNNKVNKSTNSINTVYMQRVSKLENFFENNFRRTSCYEFKQNPECGFKII